MKITYVVRLFSGFETSVKSEIWKPTGVPTIYKMLDALSLKFEITLILVDKNSQYKGIKEVPLDGLNAKVYVVGGSKSVLLREVKQLFYIWRLIDKPNVLYVDHANIIIGGLYARLSKIPVIFRVMGCFGIKTSFNNDNLFKKIYRWCYKAPFKRVIATQDGSGVEFWLNKALSHHVKRDIILNGVDNVDSTINLDLPNNKTIVLFIGRLENDKGCIEFVDAILKTLKKDKNIYALVIGGGSRREFLKNKVKQQGETESFKFIDRVKHSDILSIQKQSDIYVSLNRAGNLSNVNLEAMSVGQCMIIPESQPDSQIDVITDKLLSKESVLRISSADDIDEISDAIVKLHNNQELRSTMSNSIKKEAQRFLFSWDERITKEK